LQKQANKSEKQTKNRNLTEKTSPTCVGRKIQQNKQSATTLNKNAERQTQKIDPEMSKLS